MSVCVQTCTWQVHIWSPSHPQLTTRSVGAVARPVALFGCRPPLTSFRSTPACLALNCARFLYILQGINNTTLLLGLRGGGRTLTG
jgi:hypothetical protein